MTIAYNDVSKQWNEIEKDCLPKITDFLRSGKYTNLDIQENFENKFSDYVNSPHRAVAVSSGTSGLKIALYSLNLDKSTCVVVPGNTFISNATIATQLGYDVKVIDVDCYLQIDTIVLEEYIAQNRDRYKNIVITAVHLTGHPCDMKAIMYIAKKYNCSVLEDCSQALGTRSAGNVNVGKFGDVAVYSCYATKNLGAAGECGIITSNNPRTLNTCRAMSRMGSFIPDNAQDISFAGENYRADVLQCIILNEKLNHVNKWNNQKSHIADLYKKYVKEYNLNPWIETPLIADYCNFHSYHTYNIVLEPFAKSKENLNSIIKHFMLHDYNIETRINYSPMIHNSIVYDYLNYNCDYLDKIKGKVLNLPMHSFLTEEEVKYVCESLQKCLAKVTQYKT